MKTVETKLKVVDASPETAKADLEKMLTDIEAAALVKAWLEKKPEPEKNDRNEVEV